MVQTPRHPQADWSEISGREERRSWVGLVVGLLVVGVVVLVVVLHLTGVTRPTTH